MNEQKSINRINQSVKFQPRVYNICRLHQTVSNLLDNHSSKVAKACLYASSQQVLRWRQLGTITIDGPEMQVRNSKWRIYGRVSEFQSMDADTFAAIVVIVKGGFIFGD